MANRKHCLVVSLPDGQAIEKETYYLLTARKVSVGRGTENGIVLKNDAVSTTHCELRRKGTSGFEVADLSSTNGTVLNGEELTGEFRELRNGDELVIGLHVKARFIQMEEIIDSSGATDEPVSGAVTRKLTRSPKPEINPVAAAMARAGKPEPH